MMGIWFAVAFVVFIVVISLISRTPSVKEEKPKRGEWIPKLAQDAATTAKTFDESMKPTAVKVKAKQSAKLIIKDDTIRSYMDKQLIRFPFYIQERQTFYLLNNQEDVKAYSTLMDKKIALIDSMDGCVLFIVRTV